MTRDNDDDGDDAGGGDGDDHGVIVTTIMLITSMKSRPDLMNPGPRVLLLPGIERPDIDSKLYLLSSTYFLE